MQKYFNNYRPIVRIGNRMFWYEYKSGVIRGTYPELLSMGFADKGEYYERPVSKDEIDSAYYIKRMYVIYKGFKGVVESYDRENHLMQICFWDEDGIKLGIEPFIDKADKNIATYLKDILDSEVDNIFEVRQHAEGFPFESPRIVFHKKDGEWIPYHELGALLKDDEWI